jgi:hypothetical protein
MPAQLTAIPLELIKPHPKLAFRFSYDVAGLAESIKSSADENTPNGQLNPGRVVQRPDGQGYYVYVGVRRYFALKHLHDATHEERFGSFTAYVDTGMTELKMFVRAKRENDDEKGERQGLSVLEEVSGIREIKDNISAEDLDKELRRLLGLAERLEKKRLWKLYEIERSTHFKFRVPHLEHLCKIENEKEFFLTAANTAGFGYKSEEMAKAEENRNAAYSLSWFHSIFPDYSPDRPPGAGRERKQGDSKNEEQSTDEGSGDEHLEVHRSGVLVALCPTCRSGNMLELQGRIEATHLPPDPDGERRTEVAESVSRVGCTCVRCGGPFYLFVKHLEGRTYAVEASSSKSFREPRGTTEALELRYDYKEKTWQKIQGDKIVGPLQLAPPGR